MQTIPWLLAIRGLAFIPFRLYQGIWQYASIWDLRNIILAVGLSSFAFLGLVASGLGLTKYSLSVMAIDSLLLIVSMGGARFLQRIILAMGIPVKDKLVLKIGRAHV